jgi:hypothetical protein
VSQSRVSVSFGFGNASSLLAHTEKNFSDLALLLHSALGLVS